MKKAPTKAASSPNCQFHHLQSDVTVITASSQQARAREVVAWRQEQAMVTRQEQDLVAIRQKIQEHQQVYLENRAIMRERGFKKSWKLKSEQQRQKELTPKEEPELAIVVKGIYIEIVLYTVVALSSDPFVQ